MLLLSGLAPLCRALRQGSRVIIFACVIASGARKESVCPRAPTTYENPSLSPRLKFRYSVIPGGARSAEELKAAQGFDPVVAEHYKDFGALPNRYRPPRNMFVYVSYRIQDHVYWSSTRREIPAGEALLSDGRHLARVRCGNRLSFVPHSPTLVGAEPSDAELDSLEPPPKLPDLHPEYPDLLFPQPTNLAASSSQIHSTGGTTLGENTSAESVTFLGTDDVAPGVFKSVGGYRETLLDPSRELELVNTPEPQSFGLVFVGALLVGSFLLWKTLRRFIQHSKRRDFLESKGGLAASKRKSVD